MQLGYAYAQTPRGADRNHRAVALWLAYDRAYREPDPASRDAHLVDLIGSADFQFAWAEGGMGKYKILVVASNGDAEFTFHDGPHFPSAQNPGYIDASRKQARFVLDPQTMGELRNLLADISYWKMDRAYGSNVHDGTQWYFRVDASGRRKHVYCDNNFPRKAVRLSEFVHQRILSNQTAAISTGATIDENTYRAQMKRFDDR